MCGSGERERESLGTRDQRSRQAHFLDASAPDSLTCTSPLTRGTQRKAMVHSQAITFLKMKTNGVTSERDWK